ncbi:aminoglycoside O-nucleotidyltransferase ANT(4')-Ia [Bacillus carboniphilus]|uniref:Aminoglycoside O-nucleotidyltransferase ANT(4')-Ia n=1 Tax=Bacillus carboniphilus TaxID=86663 RepID=A0ABN0W320_9BACI
MTVINGEILSFPNATTREEKLKIIEEIKNRLLMQHGEQIIAIGVYGSIGLGKEGPYSDIEMHVVTEDGYTFSGKEFIFPPFKIEIGVDQKSELLEEAQKVHDGWAIKAGVYHHVMRIYDPHDFFGELKKAASNIPVEDFHFVMREFMIWEPYETMGKIRNNVKSGNLNYLSLGAMDIAWQTAKLIGLANQKFYSTRARTYEESLQMKSRPKGYDDLITLVMKGDLLDKEKLYRLCELLWTGLNEWFLELGITYKENTLPL